MRLDTSHRVIVALTGFAIGLRVLMPIDAPSRFGSRVDAAATLLQVVGILLLGAALFFILSFSWGPAVSRRMVDAGLTMGWLLVALVFAFGASKTQTGLVLLLEQTNWPLTTAAVVIVSLLSSLTWGLVRNRSAWVGLRKGLVASLLLVLVGAGLSMAQQWRFHRLLDLRQKQEAERRQAEALRTRIIEGEQIGPLHVPLTAQPATDRDRIIEGKQIGPLHLGISVDEARAVIQRTFSTVERTRTGLVQYDWCCEGDIEWRVFVDPKVDRSVGLSLSLIPPFIFVWEPNQLPYETTKGVRFGHSLKTVSAVYGPPSKTYTFDYGRVILYYAPLRTEFEFRCNRTGCSGFGGGPVLKGITIFAPGWSPETLWGPGGRSNW